MRYNRGFNYRILKRYRVNGVMYLLFEYKNKQYVMEEEAFQRQVKMNFLTKSKMNRFLRK